LSVKVGVKPRTILQLTGKISLELDFYSSLLLKYGCKTIFSIFVVVG